MSSKNRNLLKEFCYSHGMTLTELHRATGLATRTISNIGNGVTSPTPSTIKKIADALGVSYETVYSILPEGQRLAEAINKVEKVEPIEESQPSNTSDSQPENTSVNSSLGV